VGLVGCGLEELDGVAGGIVDQDLLAADADDHVTAETDPCLPECVDHGGQVVDLDREVVLSARCRHGFVGHGLARRVRRPAG
jgi:hypothetical protein